MKRLDNLVMENVRLIFRNFEGRKDKFNKNGNRGFSVIVDDPEAAVRLRHDGWMVKELAPRDEGDLPTYYIPVAVAFENRPPKIVLISGGRQTILDEDSVHELDYSEIRKVDLSLNPYHWTIEDRDGKKSGVKAYLKTMYVTLEEDEFAHKYGYSSEVDELPFN